MKDHCETHTHPIHVKASDASETPVCDGERVYAYFGNVGLFCYDLTWKLFWSRTWDVVPTQLDWGTGASPVLHKDRIYIVNDNEKASYIIALDTLTGKEVWKTDRAEKSNWATPCTMRAIPIVSFAKWQLAVRDRVRPAGRRPFADG